MTSPGDASRLAALPHFVIEPPDDAEALTYFDTDVTRDDRAGPGLDHDEALRNAPDHDGTFFLVPKIVEKDEA